MMIVNLFDMLAVGSSFPEIHESVEDFFAQASSLRPAYAVRNARGGN
jgi:hypothetical protein